MGQTANFHLRYADLSDPADAQAATGNLAEDVDAALTQIAAAPKQVPGSIVLWPNNVLPDPARYGRWAWCDGATYATASYPDCAANIAGVWRTFDGAADPGAGQFRVPDLRSLVPVPADPMPASGAAKSPRLIRASGIGTVTGVEYHVLTTAEMPAHDHAVYDPTHGHGVGDPTHNHYNAGRASTQGGAENAATVGPNDRGDGILLRYAGTGIWIGGSATGIAIYSNGGGGAHENMPRSVFIPYIIFLG